MGRRLPRAAAAGAPRARHQLKIIDLSSHPPRAHRCIASCVTILSESKTNGFGFVPRQAMAALADDMGYGDAEAWAVRSQRARVAAAAERKERSHLDLN